MSVEFVANSYQTDHSSPARFILSHVRRHPIFIVGFILGAFFNAALGAAVPAYIGNAVDAVRESGVDAMDTVIAMTLAIVISQTVRAFVQYTRNVSAETFGQRIERDVRDELYGSLLGKSMSFHDSMPVGEIMARVTNDVREINLMMNPGVNLIVGSGMFLLLPIISSPLIHPQLILVPLVFVFLHVIVQFYFVKWMHPVAQHLRESFGHMNARLAEALDGLQVVKGSAQEKNEAKHFNELTDTVRDHFIEQGKIEAFYLSNLLFGLAFVAGFVHSMILFQAGEIALGDIITFNGLIGLFGFPVFTSLNSLSRLALGYASAERILSIINMRTDLDRNVDGYKGTMRGEIIFEDVDFSYLDAGKQVLSNVSFRVEPGQTVAIVGQTGAGKSTVTKLMNRIYDVNKGRILVDGVDVREWDLASLRSQISIIEQDIFLFSRSIAENIAFGNPDATQEEIEAAARKAQAHDFIMSFPNGYETHIGQRGVTLSGGQRQRLALARAFLTNPPVLILDDSTSAIDSATEDKIQRAIWTASKGRTTILITHRLSQIRWADHIVVLRNGTIAAQGNHDTLLASSESYRRIFARYETGSKSATTDETDPVKARE